MSQNNVIFSDDPSGAELLDSKLTPMKSNILTNNSGTARPAYAVAGTDWLDTTTTPWVWKFFDGTDDISIGTVNATTNSFQSSGVRLDNITATTNPDVNDDSADGYSAGSVWVNTTTDEIYFATDVAVGAAVWRKMRYDTTAYLPLAGGTATGDILLPASAIDTASLKAITCAAAQAGQSGENINKFYNASFAVAQRGITGTVTAGSPGYTLDGWIASCTGANISWSRSGPGLNSRYCLSLTGATSVTATTIKQRIEAHEAAQLANRTITIQMAIFNSTGASFTPNLLVNRANASDDFSAVTTELASTALQSCPIGWSVVAYTLTLSSNAANGIEVIFDLGGVLNSGAKSVYFSLADIRYTQGVAIGQNSAPPRPEVRNVKEELSLCQRYREDGYALYHGDVTNTGSYGCFINFKVTKRAVPTITWGTVVVHLGAFDTSAPTVGTRFSTTIESFNPNKTATASSGDRGWNAPWTASCEL